MKKTYNSYSSGKHVFENITIYLRNRNNINEKYSVCYENKSRKVDDEEKEYKIDNDNDKIITKEQFKLLEKCIIISFFMEYIIEKKESSGLSENLIEKTKEFVEEWEEEIKKIQFEQLKELIQKHFNLKIVFYDKGISLELVQKEKYCFIDDKKKEICFKDQWMEAEISIGYNNKTYFYKNINKWVEISEEKLKEMIDKNKQEELEQQQKQKEEELIEYGKESEEE